MHYNEFKFQQSKKEVGITLKFVKRMNYKMITSSNGILCFLLINYIFARTLAYIFNMSLKTANFQIT